MSKQLKFCPLLVGKQEVKAIMVGQGDYEIPLLYPCIQDKCMAYRSGSCDHFQKSCFIESEGENEN